MSMFPNIRDMAVKEAEKVEADLMKIDMDHDGISDVQEAKTLLTEGFAQLQVFESKFTPAEIEAALNVLFPGRFSAAEITAAEGGLNKVIAGFLKLGTVAANAKQALLGVK
jgi:hypothetical protein